MKQRRLQSGCKNDRKRKTKSMQWMWGTECRERDGERNREGNLLYQGTVYFNAEQLKVTKFSALLTTDENFNIFVFKSL